LTGVKYGDIFSSMSSKLLSTVQLAREVGVPRATLQYWIKEGKIAAPRTRLRKGIAVRLWTAGDVEKARKLKGTLKRGPEPKRGKKT
jgi:DNA-binding transcriptional MerR regulator